MKSSREEMALEQLRSVIQRMAVDPNVDLTEFLKIFTLSRYPKRALVIDKENATDRLFFITRGLLRIYYIKEDKEITNWFIEENNFFAASYSLFTGQPNEYLYETLEDMEVLSCEYAQMEKLYNSNHAYEHIGRKMIEYYYAVFLKKSYDVMFLSAEERYQSILDHHPEWMNRIPLKHIASYLGITQETLSRLRAK